MKRRITPILAICLLITFATLPLTPFCLAEEQATGDGEIFDGSVTQEDQTGTEQKAWLSA